MILPGATLGMLGGGQLGRMFTTAAQTMGYKVIVLDPDKNSPAGIIADQHICAAYTDETALTELAQHCAAITTEFENIPASTLAFLEKRTVVHPSSSALASTQNRNTEKNFIHAQGIATVPFVRITSRDDFADISSQIKFPAILKVATFGYDGKGQIVCEDLQTAYEAFDALGQKECVLEQRIDLEREISVVLARGEDGQITAFPVAENVHINGILHSTSVPSAAAETQQKRLLKWPVKLLMDLITLVLWRLSFLFPSKAKLLPMRLPHVRIIRGITRWMPAEPHNLNNRYVCYAVYPLEVPN